MRSGQLRHLVTIQQTTASRDSDTGEATDAWSTFAECYANVMPLRGNELIQAQQVQAHVTHRVSIRFLDGVTGDMRVIHDSRTLHIEGVIDVGERGREMELMCREVAQ